MVAEKYTFTPTFQKKILSLIARENHFMLEYRNVFKVGYFEESLRDIAKLLLEVFDKNHAVVSKDTFVEYCRERSLDIDPDLLDEIYEIKADNLVREMVMNFAKRASLRLGVLTVADGIDETDDSNLPVLVNKLYEALRVGTPSSPGISFFSSEIEEVLASKEYLGAIRHTGLKELDRYINGLRVGDCFVVMGSTGKGKSIFLVNIGVNNLAEDGDIYHFTIGDLSEEDVYARYLSRITKLPLTEIVKDPKMPEIKERLAQYKVNVQPGNLIIKYLPPGSCTVGDIRSICTSFRAKLGRSPRGIIIDYPDELICPKARSQGSSYEDMGGIYSEIKGLGFEMDCFVAVASQVNRAGLQKSSSEDVQDVESIMMQCADSMKKCFKADTIFSLFQSKKEREPDQNGYQKMRGFIAKSRRGIDGKVVHLKVNKGIMRFLSTQPPISKENQE